MAVIVEDGSIVANANSYVSVANADAYFSARNNTTWTAYSTAVKEAALLYACQWLNARYEWPGVISDVTQTLSWPRDGAEDSEGRDIDPDEVPGCIVDAQCEAAAAHALEGLNEVLARGGAISSVTVDVISVAFSASAVAGRTFPYIDSLVARVAYPFAAGVVPTYR